MITVADLIEYLKKQPQDLPIAYDLHSEQVLMELDQINIEELCEPRNDGWLHDKRPDKPFRQYLVFPGN